MNEATIFADALVHSPEARPAYLDKACAGDGKLRRRVEALLKALTKPDEVLDRPIHPNRTVDYPPVADNASMIDHAPMAERVGTTIGQYKLMEQIGEG